MQHHSYVIHVAHKAINSYIDFNQEFNLMNVHELLNSRLQLDKHSFNALLDDQEAS